MNIFLSIGTKIVIIALIAYSIAIITEQRKKIINNRILTFIIIGLFFDITATIFMIIGSSNSPFTPHGLLGYSSLIAMIIDGVLLWKNKGVETVPHGLHIYTRIAYIWWLLAFISGGIIAVVKYV